MKNIKNITLIVLSFLSFFIINTILCTAKKPHYSHKKRSIQYKNPSKKYKKNIKLLVLIIASDDEPVYREFQKIWRLYMHNYPEQITSFFIKGNPLLTSEYTIDGDTIWTRTPETIIPGIINKTISSIEAIQKASHLKFDYILRTNLSSFYIFPRLLQFLNKCPKNNFYCASDIRTPYSGIGSGCGFLISHDIVKLLIDNKLRFINNTSTHDDVLIGEFLRANNIKLIQHKRTDFFSMLDWETKKNTLKTDNVFHCRVKGPTELRIINDVYIHSQLLKIFYNKNF